MLKLTLTLIFLVAFTAAKVINNEILSPQKKELFPLNPWDKSETQCELEDKLWVLNLSNGKPNFEQLFLANGSDEKIFRKVMAPTIRNYEASESITKEENSKHINNEYESVNYDIVERKIIEMMNKLFLNTWEDPNIEFIEVPTNQEQSLKLYFKGPYTSVIMTSGRKIYQYFNSPPSPLPEWFFTEHENLINNKVGKYVVIPKIVRFEFMLQFLKMLDTYFNILM